jgi:HKD family nuclease
LSVPTPIPGSRWVSGEAALDELLNGATSVKAAIAFVTRGGVGVLHDLVTKYPSIETIEIVARGAPITEPEALLELRDRLQASVRVVTGAESQHFHPKLWLAETGSSELRVLSGSGNLTTGGLRGNKEQFERFTVADSATTQAQIERFDRLTTDSVELERFENSIAWRAWIDQGKRRRELAEKIAEMDAILLELPAVNRDADKEELRRDLWRIHDRTVEAKLQKLDGRRYNPSGFRLELEGHRGTDEPVVIATRLCRGSTGGFEELERLDRLDLTVEFLVANQAKGYHTMIPADIRASAKERLRTAEAAGATSPDLLTGQ